MTSEETLNFYFYSWIYMTEMSDKWAKHFMQLSLFSQHVTFKCVKVDNSKRGRKQNQMFFQDKQNCFGWQGVLSSIKCEQYFFPEAEIN